MKTKQSCVLSDALIAANLRLLARRAALKSAEKPTSPPAETPQEPTLPSHLGWGSAVLSDALRPPPPPPQEPQFVIQNEENLRAPVETVQTPPKNLTLNVHPSLLVAILKVELVAVGRVWLLARHLDTQGRGGLSIDDLRQQLTKKASPLRLCGWRRLRQLLQAGEGVFWKRDNRDRLWLRSHAKVAISLDVERFAGSPVALPIAAVLQPMGKVRAAFYATFHAGRDGQPISRHTLSKITGVSERAQRDYDRRLQVKRITNIALSSGHASAEAIHYKHGHAAFRFIDKRGKHGAPGQTYWAQRLPNSYHAPYPQLERSRTKSANWQLKTDLAKNGTQGNEFERYPRLFYTDGKQGQRAVTRWQDAFVLVDQATHSGDKPRVWAAWSRSVVK